MSTAAAQRELFMPQPPGGLARGLVLALLVHAMLVAGLAVSVNWHTSDPAAMQAELWAAVPQVAAPRAAVTEERSPPPPAAPEPRPTPAPPPPPPPRAAEPERVEPPPKPLPDPQIALERERQKKEALRKQELAEREKADRAAKAEKARQAEAELAEQKRKEALAQDRRELAAKEKEKEREKAKAQEKAQELARQKDAASKAEQAAKAEKAAERAEAQRAADAREAAIKRMTAQAGGATGEPGSSGTAAQNAAPSAGYTGRVIARIKPNIVFVDDLATNPAAEVQVRLAPDGRILSQKLVKSSGIREWDQAVQRAIERTEVLPRDTDGRVPTSIFITFRPRE